MSEIRAQPKLVYCTLSKMCKVWRTKSDSKMPKQQTVRFANCRGPHSANYQNCEKFPSKKEVVPAETRVATYALTRAVLSYAAATTTSEIDFIY